MLSKNKARFIITLQRKKARDEERLYVIEGDKIVREFLVAGRKITQLVAKPEFLKTIQESLLKNVEEIIEASYDDLKQVSTLKTPHNALALVSYEDKKISIPAAFADSLCCALESVQDPGNLGTIIRAGAWFGIRNIVCSPDCVDVYNPKVIQASMGALLHVDVYYHDLNDFLNQVKESGKPVFGTVLGGESVYEHDLSNTGVILLGNESRGISEYLNPFLTDRIMIPGAGTGPGIDSLNVGMAASVVFSEFRRRFLLQAPGT
ncbi:MAG TPA: RNA methyltransferase [Bacteroidales bacterium]|nr:RNA methyltransferase [Bacteroidales bacterium]